MISDQENQYVYNLTQEDDVPDNGQYTFSLSQDDAENIGLLHRRSHRWSRILIR